MLNQFIQVLSKHAADAPRMNRTSPIQGSIYTSGSKVDIEPHQNATSPSRRLHNDDHTLSLYHSLPPFFS